MVSELRKTGVPVIMHSDGNINMFFDDLVRTDISGYHPVERSAGMKLGELKRRYGDRLTFLGNVDNKVTLVTGTSEQVEAEVKECIKAAAAGGRFILASDHSLHDDIPNKNVFALYDAGRRYGAYPISI